jgi:hypothetical protein
MPASKVQRAATAERRNKAIAMKLAGADWALIATSLDYSGPAAACKDVTRAMEASLAAQVRNAELLRHQELLRLDRLQRGLWTRAVAGDHKCADTVLRVIQTRIKLLGLDTITAAPVGAASLLDKLARQLGLGEPDDGDGYDDGYPDDLPDDQP